MDGICKSESVFSSLFIWMIENDVFIKKLLEVIGKVKVTVEL